MLDRNDSYDGLKGFLLIISLFIISSQILLVDFKDWQYGMEGSTILSKWILSIHYTGRLSLVFLGSYLSNEFYKNISDNFFPRKIIQYILIPLIVYSFIFEYIGLWWTDISTLGFAFILSFILNKQTKFLKYLLLIIFLLVTNPLLADWKWWAELNVLTSIIFGDFTESVFFNLASVFPVMLVAHLIYDISDKVKSQRNVLIYSFIGSVFLTIIIYFLNYYYLTGGLNYRYPPHILEYSLSVSVGLLFSYISIIKIKFFHYFMPLGKKAYGVFLVSIVSLYLMTEQASIGSYQFSLLKLIIAIIIYFIGVISVLNIVENKNVKKKNN